MFFLKAIGCRLFQWGFRALLPVLPYREPKTVASCEEIPFVLQKERATAVLIVTDGGIVKNGLTAPLEAVLKNSQIPYALYDKTQPNPTTDNVEEALRLYHARACNALIAIGGGSAMDCAKAVGARVAYPKKPLSKMGGVLRVLRKLPTLIAIPTTAGTGSETTLAAVITDPKTHRKYAMMSFPLIPHYAVLDASLTYSLPPHLTATTGMDALTHAVEAYIGRSTTKETRRHAMEATKLIFENLENAYKNGRDQTAREQMLRAAYQAGVAFSKSYVGYVHAVAHSLGGAYGTPHGLANAVLLPHVLLAYGKRVEKKLHRLAIAAGVATAGDTPKEAAERLISEIFRMNREMQIPATLQGIVAKDIPALARRAEKEANPLYPVPKLLTAKELERFYYAVSEQQSRV